MAEALKLQQPGGDGALAAVVALQQEYALKIAQATASGDVAAIQQLVAELTVKTQHLLGGGGPHLSVVPPAPQKPPLYDNSVCALSLDTIVYDGDRDTLIALNDDAQFKKVADELLADAQPYNARKDLLKSALKLTPKLAPKVYEILARCRDNIGLKAELELYVCPDVQFNAFCYPPLDGRFIIGVTSALLEKFDQDELAFVLGHEIGHALFAHHRYPVQFLLANGEGHLSPLHAMRLYSWKRNAELSSDRVGLLCGRNFDAAARAFFKLSSGVTDNSLSFQLREYIDQFSDLQTEMQNTEVDPEDWYSTHPFSPMRLKALDMFNRSETYQKLIGRDGSSSELSEEQLEFEIKKFMSMMEPSYLQESSELGDFMKNYVFLGGWLVSAANGQIDESEVRALGSILDAGEVQSRISAMAQAKAEDVWPQIEAIAEKLNVMLPVVSKLNVLKDLSVIAGADGNIEECELEALYQLSAHLHIRPEFIDHVLESAQEED